MAKKANANGSVTASKSPSSAKSSAKKAVVTNGTNGLNGKSKTVSKKAETSSSSDSSSDEETVPKATQVAKKLPPAKPGNLFHTIANT